MSLVEYLPPKAFWPELIIPEGFDDLPESLNLTEELLDRHLRDGRGDRTALYFEDRKITYREIAEYANRLGNSLLLLGIEPRDRIGIRMTNLPETIIANFAILKIGAIPVPISPLWSKSEIIYVACDALLKAIVVNRSLLTEVRRAEAELVSVKAFIVVDDGPSDKPPGGERYCAFAELVARGKKDLRPFRLKRNDVAFLLYTSGTTGPPKGCAHTMAGVWIHSRLVTQYVWDLGEGDVLAGSAPISFAAGYGTFAIVPFTSRGAVSLLPKFSPEALLGNIARHRASVLTGIPTAYRKLLEAENFEDYDLSSLRLCTVGGDALGEETFDAWLAKTGLPIWENFASTELFNTHISTRMGEKPKRKSIGLPVPGFQVKVINEQGETCPPGTIGSLSVKGPTGIIYWNPRGHDGRLMAAQRLSVRNGWNILGDAFYRDDEGYLYFAGREDDMIKSSGYRISPGEIEAVLASFPMIREAAVIGVPDSIMGSAVKAIVVLEDKAGLRPQTEQEIRDYCREHMAVYKIPRVFAFLSHLPRTPTGKIARKELK